MFGQKLTHEILRSLPEGTLVRYHGSNHLLIGKFYLDTQNLELSQYRLRRITLNNIGESDTWAIYRFRDYEIITEAQALLLMLEEE